VGFVLEEHFVAEGKGLTPPDCDMKMRDINGRKNKENGE
jgi:hypothetical protein